MTKQRLSMRLLWKLRGDYAESDRGPETVSSFLGYVEKRL